MRKITIIVTVLLQVVVACQVKAQIDPHFSQYYAYPLWLNPALTGVMNGDSRVNANYKNQYPSIGNSYNTSAVSADFHATDKVSIGINVLDQAAGSAGYNYFSAYGTLGYNIKVSADGNQRVSFGAQAGLINRSFDPSKLQLGSQYDPTMGYNPNLPANENFLSNSAAVFDAGAGVFYYNGDPQTKANLFGGLSVGHLSRPNDPITQQGGAGSKIPLRYTFQAGVRIKASEFFDITPHAIYIREQHAQEKAIGAYSEFKLQNDNGLIAGAMYRFADAAVANVGYHVKSLIIGVSYDFNTSSLNRATNAQGGMELSLSYVFHKHLNQPDPICPRL